MPHDHGHAHLDPGSGDRRVAIAIWANAALTLAQILGGLLSGSLALIADALHNLSDMAALVIAFAARKIARRPADARMTFGYGRIEVVAALLEWGADASIAADDRYSPLEVALYNDADAELEAGFRLQLSAKRLAFGKSLHERLAPESPVAVLPADVVLLVLETAEQLGSCFAQVARRIEAHEERRRRQQAEKAGAGEDLCSSEEEDSSRESWCARTCRSRSGRRTPTTASEGLKNPTTGCSRACES